MKKIILPLFLLMLIGTVDAQDKKDIKDKNDKIEKIKPENQGQQISDVNAWYKSEKKAIKRDASLSKEARKASLSFLKQEKKTRIHAINGGQMNSDNGKGMKEKEMKDKDKKDHDGEMHDKNEKKEKMEKEPKVKNKDKEKIKKSNQ